MRIAIIGAGNVGGTLAQAWSARGHAIALGVPDPRGARALSVVAARWPPGPPEPRL
jgi:predicted dinucleotide-binding enzyme